MNDKKNVITDLKPKELTKTPLYDNSFETCVVNITGIYASDFQSIDKIVYTVGLENWYQPYIDVLRVHGYDMIFFNFNDSDVKIKINDKKSLQEYDLRKLPTGKCVLLGEDSDGNFKCVVGQLHNSRVRVIHDPTPELNLAEVFEIGFFISTFIIPETA